MTLDQLNIGAVWQALGGCELRHGRGKAFWRDGDSFSISIDLEKNVWYDFRDNCGGGMLALVEHVHNCERSGAIDWLEKNCNLDHRNLTHAERQRRAEIEGEATILAQRLADFHRGLVLAVHRLAPLNEALILSGIDGPEILADQHRAAFLLKQATPDTVARIWKNSPQERETIEAIGRADREHAEEITKALVFALSTLTETVTA